MKIVELQAQRQSDKARRPMRGRRLRCVHCLSLNRLPAVSHRRRGRVFQTARIRRHSHLTVYRPRIDAPAHSEAYLDGLRGVAVVAVVIVHCWSPAGASRMSVRRRGNETAVCPAWPTWVADQARSLLPQV